MLEILEDIAELFVGNKRQSALRHFARQKGFSYIRRLDPYQLPAAVRQLGFADSKKKKKSLRGVLTKQLSDNGIFVTIFDYVHYHDFGPKTTTVYMYEVTDLDVPSFAVRPRNPLSKIGSIFSSSEWSEVNKQFDRGWTVESADMNHMRMTITFQFAEEIIKLPDWHVEGVGPYIVGYRMHEATDIIDMDNAHDVMLELIDIIGHDNVDQL